MSGASSRRVRCGAYAGSHSPRLAFPSGRIGISVRRDRAVMAGAIHFLLLALASTCSKGKSAVPVSIDGRPAGGNGGTAGTSGAGGTGADDASTMASGGQLDTVSENDGPSVSGDLTVAQLLADAVVLLDQQVTVVGEVFEDTRQKLSTWPAPALSLFVLQDGGDAPGYLGSSGIAFVQLYAAADLTPYLHRSVRVQAFLHSATLPGPSGQSTPLLYLEVVAISVR